MKTTEPYLRDLLLIGGGHAHVQVLRRFGMKPEPGVRLTLVSRESESPYTGMLPGYIAGEYARDEIVIDLLRLARFANCRFIEADVLSISPAAQVVELRGERSALRYDILSLNTGGDCSLPIPGGEFVQPIKPIGRFLQHSAVSFESLVAAGSASIAVIGGGPGSVEFALALRQRIGSDHKIMLVTRAHEIVPEHGGRVHQALAGALANHEIEVIAEFEVVKVERSRDRRRLFLHPSDGGYIECSHAYSVTGVGAPTWLADSGLEVDDAGFLAVDQRLQSVSSPNVFGAGDAVSIARKPRPKSGVYSVRAGPILASNLCRFVTGQSLKKFRPQRQALALIRTEPGRATASRGLLQSSGRWLWRYKDWIDRRFMQRFQELPVMTQTTPTYRGELRAESVDADMRCGGCGAKLGADLLQRVLHRLDIHADASVSMGIGEDAAVVNFGNSTVALSCDGFRAMLDDPWLFGRIAAHHALNDLYAMNSEPSAALALVTVPYMNENLMEEDLFQLMSGALSVFNENDVRLVGGHTAEGIELSLGFTVAGSIGFNLMTKDALVPGETLVLTKPLGVGAILAGGMDGRCSASAVRQAIATMDVSNANAMRVFSDNGVRACTDVTGFGLGGHLGEMLRASGLSATLDLNATPYLPAALHAIATGVESTLQTNNEKVFADWVYDCSSLDPRLRLLVDPQTSGGLLGSISAEYANSCVQQLHAAGYRHARCIGTIDETTEIAGRVTILS